MNKLFTIAKRAGDALMLHVAALLANERTYQPVTILSSNHHPVPDHRNSTAAADKRCARRRRNIAKRGGRS